jgi:predicted permease
MAPLVIQLALSALQAIAQVAVVCSFGHILARKGYLNHQLQKGLSTLSVKFFTPCLLFANTAASVTRDNFLQLWPLPVYFILFSATAWLIARIGATCFGFTKSQTRFTIATLMFSNTNSLPIGLIESLAMSGAAVWLHWREDESREALAARGIAYVVFYSILGNVIRWSYGVFLLEHDLDAVSTNACITSNTSDTHPIQKPSRKGKLPAIDVERANRRSSASSISSSSHASLVATSTPHERSPLLDSTSRTYLRPPTILLTGPAHQASLVVEEDTHPDASTRILPSSTSYFASSTTTPVDSSESDSDSEYEDVCDTIIVDRMTIDKDEDDQIECERLLDQDGSPNVPDHPHRPPHRSFSRRLRHVIHRIKHYLASVHHFLRPILTAPFLAALFGLLVALTPLRSLLVDPDAPLRTTLFAAVKSCGNAAVPVILICLGAQLTTLAYVCRILSPFPTTITCCCYSLVYTSAGGWST